MAKSGGHQRQHSMRVEVTQEASTIPELNEFAELQCWSTRLFASSIKKPQRKWLRMRDYTLYWCKSQTETQAEGCIRFLYDDVVLEKVSETQIKFKCRDKDRMFEFDSKLDMGRWFDRITKTIAIRDCNGINFQEDGRSVFKNLCNLFLLNQQQWIAVGQGNLELRVDTKQSGGIPDVAAIMSIATDDATKSYEFLLTPYIKPKGNKTWILPKSMDMNTDFNQQTLAFRFPSENDAQVFHNVFDGTYRSTSTEAKQEETANISLLEQDNKMLKEENMQLQQQLESLKAMKDAMQEKYDRVKTGDDGSRSNRSTTMAPHTPLDPVPSQTKGRSGPPMSDAQLAEFYAAAVEIVKDAIKEEVLSDLGGEADKEIRELKYKIEEFESSSRVPQAKLRDEIDKIKEESTTGVSSKMEEGFSQLGELTQRLDSQIKEKNNMKKDNVNLRQQLATKVSRLLKLETDVYRMQRNQ